MGLYYSEAISAQTGLYVIQIILLNATPLTWYKLSSYVFDVKLNL